ncbi:MAG: RNA methyltransferase [Phycisphaerae bacterium]|nr:RNA methyltransferase [Phycisphaerae bacterium]
MRCIRVESLEDPRLDDYRAIKERQLLPAFSWAAQRRPDPEAPWGKFMAEGEVVLHRLVRSTCRTLSVLVTPTRLNAAEADLALLPPDTPVFVIEPAHLEPLTGFSLHRGLIAVAARPRPLEPEAVAAKAAPGRPLVILEDLSNHDNVGGVFRNAAAFGAAGVLLSPRCADPLYRKSVRVSVGYAMTVSWAFVMDWPAGVARLRDRGIEVLAMTPGPGAERLQDAAIACRGKPAAVLLGAEGPGLTAGALAAGTRRVSIAMAAGVDSLNVVVAGAVALHALATPERGV